MVESENKPVYFWTPLGWRHHIFQPPSSWYPDNLNPPHPTTTPLLKDYKRPTPNRISKVYKGVWPPKSRCAVLAANTICMAQALKWVTRFFFWKTFKCFNLLKCIKKYFKIFTIFTRKRHFWHNTSCNIKVKVVGLNSFWKSSQKWNTLPQC